MRIYTLDDIRTHNRVSGGKWFDPGTMRWHKSRLSGEAYNGPGGVYFVSSEANFDGTARYFTVRQYNPETGGISTPNGYNDLSRYMAHKQAAELARGEQ